MTKNVSDPVVEGLILDLLKWLEQGDRSYEETMDAWRTSCPKLPVWEDANDRGLVTSVATQKLEIVRITPAGRALLERHRLPGARRDSRPVALQIRQNLEEAMTEKNMGQKDQANSLPWRRQVSSLRWLTFFVVVLFAPAPSNAATSKLYAPAKDEAGALRLAQVMKLATREEILALTKSRELLLASGLKDADFQDGSLAMGRVFCCHPSTEEGTSMWIYVPPGVHAEVGDLVVVRMGHEGNKKEPGKVNEAVEVREKKDAPNSQCSWEPRNERYWTRVLYCTWMPSEGWTLKGGLHKTWLKRADAKPQ